MSSFTPSRRSVLRTAAWSAPVVAVATAAPAFAVSPDAFQEITTGPLPFDATYLGTASLGEWTVVLTTTVPVNLPVGTVVPAPAITAVITVPDSARGTIVSLGVEEVSGTARAPYTVQGQGELAATVTIPPSAVPASGDIVITTTGTGTGFTADTAGTFTISMENIVASLGLTPPALGGTVPSVEVTLSKQTGVDYTFATFAVA